MDFACDFVCLVYAVRVVWFYGCLVVWLSVFGFACVFCFDFVVSGLFLFGFVLL